MCYESVDEWTIKHLTPVSSQLPILGHWFWHLAVLQPFNLESGKELIVSDRNLWLNFLSLQLWMLLPPPKAIVRWEGGPDPLYLCLTSCEVSKHKQKALVLHWFIHSFLKWPAKNFVTQMFAIVFVTVLVPICLCTIPFLSLWATAQEWRLLRSLCKVLLSLSSNFDNSAAKKSEVILIQQEKQLGRCSRVYKWGFRASGLNKVLCSQRMEKGQAEDGNLCPKQLRLLFLINAMWLPALVHTCPRCPCHMQDELRDKLRLVSPSPVFQWPAAGQGALQVSHSAQPDSTGAF